MALEEDSIRSRQQQQARPPISIPTTDLLAHSLLPSFTQLRVVRKSDRSASESREKCADKATGSEVSQM